MRTNKASVAIDLLRIHGRRKFFFRILPWMVRRRYILYSGSLESPLPDFRADIPLRIGPAGESDLALLLKIRPGYYDPRLIRNRHARGQLCFMAWSGDEPVHARWVFSRSVWLPFLDRILVLGPGDVYYDQTYTVPRFRGLGVDYQTLRAMLAWFKAEGFTRHHCLLTSWDESLHRRSAAFGMVRRGEARGWNVLGLKKFAFSGLLRPGGRGEVSIAPPRD